MSNDLYQQQILDHYKHPNHYGVLKNPDFILEEANQSCGDQFTFYFKISPSPDQIIQDISFTGTGCAISTAVTSLLLNKLKGKSLSYIKKLNFSYLQKLIGVQVTPGRLKCLSLPARALLKALNKINSKPLL